MNVTEKDIFMYVWNPTALTAEIIKHIRQNEQKYACSIGLMRDIYENMDFEIDENVIASIIKKINIQD